MQNNLECPKNIFFSFKHLGERHKEMSMSCFTPKPSVCVMMCVYVAEVCSEFPLVSLCERSWDRGWASL